MITTIAVIVLIAGFAVAEALLDYVFAVVYALAVMGSLNSIIHMNKYYKKKGEICSSDVGSLFFYILMALATALFQHIYL